MSQVTLNVDPAEETALRKVADRLGMRMEDVTRALAAGAAEALDRMFSERDRSDAEQIKELSSKLTNEKLLEFARKHPPPQEWLDSDDNPFVP